jgi:hypothetical protein
MGELVVRAPSTAGPPRSAGYAAAPAAGFAVQRAGGDVPWVAVAAAALLSAALSRVPGA